VRPDLVLVGVYQLVDSDGIEQLLFDQQRLDGFDTEGNLRWPVFVMMLVVVISAHANLPSCLKKKGKP
jgi:hypothetical protein